MDGAVAMVPQALDEDELTMRVPIVLAAALAVLAVAPAPVLAQIAAAGAESSDAAASAFVEQLSTDAFALLRDKARTRAATRDSFRTMLRENVALEDIGNRLIRRQRATITPAQYAAYQAALPEFVLNAYADRLYDYADASVKPVRTIVRTAAISDVYTRVTRPGGQPIEAIWQVKKRADGKRVINNLIVSGINLSLTQEADFSAYIQKNGFDALITFLKSANSRAATRKAA
jgi:phospholipid transport system substrate-binding protein